MKLLGEETVNDNASTATDMKFFCNQKAWVHPNAIACLMLEALESLLCGWKKSGRQSEKMFVEFLDRESDFAAPKGCGPDFHTNVRCGILHRAETTAGWRVLRSGDLFDGDRTLNAHKFIRALQRVLNIHCDQLKGINWGDKRWNAARRKLNNICDNCRP